LWPETVRADGAKSIGRRQGRLEGIPRAKVQEGWSGTELITGKQLQGRVMLEPHGVAVVERKK